MLMFFLFPRISTAENETAMRQPLVVPTKFFFRNEMNHGMIVGEIVRHRLNLFFHICRVSAIFQNDETFTDMFLSCGKLRIFPVPYGTHGAFHGAGILLGVLHAFNAADGIGMPLRNAFSPESVIFPVGKNHIPIKPRERKKSRIPADGNNGNLSIFFCRPIDSGKMGGHLSMGIKRIYHVEHFRIERCLLRQVSSASPAEEKYVNLIFPCFYF